MVVSEFRIKKTFTLFDRWFLVKDRVFYISQADETSGTYKCFTYTRKYLGLIGDQDFIELTKTKKILELVE
jgi:hypothetical protein